MITLGACRRAARAGVAGLLLLVAAPVGWAATDVSHGSLPDGTPWRIDRPDRWNGVLLMSLDYAPDGGSSPLHRALQRQGFATSGLSRRVTGWSVGDAVENHVRLHALFSARHGRPARTYVLGNSLGGHTGAATLQAQPDLFDGGVLQCAGLAGLVGSWNQKLDGLFVAHTLLAAGDPAYPVLDVPADFATRARPAWLALLARAQQTPEGRARIALAAAIAQLPSWSVPGRPIPRADDVDAVQQGLYDSLAGSALPAVGQMMSSRHEIHRRAGGSVSWNVGVDYDQLLARVEHAATVQALYRRAGLPLEDDLARLRAAPRFAASPDALRWGRVQVVSRPLQVPVLTVTGIGDPISPTSAQQAFEAVVGPADLRQTYVEVAGHCGFEAAETLAAVEALHQRVVTGRWPETTAAAMNDAARASARRLGLDAAPRFVEHTPAVFTRPFRFVALAPVAIGRVQAGGAASSVRVVLTPPPSLGEGCAADRLAAASFRLDGRAPSGAVRVAHSLMLLFDGITAAPGSRTREFAFSGHCPNGVPFDETVILRIGPGP